jgi:hypothetical protein
LAQFALCGNLPKGVIYLVGFSPIQVRRSRFVLAASYPIQKRKRRAYSFSFIEDALLLFISSAHVFLTLVNSTRNKRRKIDLDPPGSPLEFDKKSSNVKNRAIFRGKVPSGQFWLTRIACAGISRP